MGAGHSHALYVHEHSAIHRLAPEAKLVAALGIVVPIALTPREAVWAFGVYALAIGSIAAFARIRLRFVAARLLAVVPFVVFALFIPFVAGAKPPRSSASRFRLPACGARGTSSRRPCSERV
jgi:cobalt/nickel transport system permease protein